MGKNPFKEVEKYPPILRTINKVAIEVINGAEPNKSKPLKIFLQKVEESELFPVDELERMLTENSVLKYRTGDFNRETYQTVKELLAWILFKRGLTTSARIMYLWVYITLVYQTTDKDRKLLKFVLGEMLPPLLMVSREYTGLRRRCPYVDFERFLPRLGVSGLWRVYDEEMRTVPVPVKKPKIKRLIDMGYFRLVEGRREVFIIEKSDINGFKHFRRDKEDVTVFYRNPTEEEKLIFGPSPRPTIIVFPGFVVSEHLPQAILLTGTKEEWLKDVVSEILEKEKSFPPRTAEDLKLLFENRTKMFFLKGLLKHNKKYLTF